MAFLTNSNSTLKNKIIAYVKRLVGITTTRAFDIILNPCCDVTITDIDFTCVSTGVADITITLSAGTQFPKDGTAVVTATVAGVTRSYTATYTSNSTTIFLNDAAIVAGSASYKVYLLFPTDYDLNQGVYMQTAAFSKTNATCA